MAFSLGGAFSPLVIWAIAAPLRLDRRQWAFPALFLFLFGGLALFSTHHNAWQAIAPATFASTPALQTASIEGVIVDLTLSSRAPQLALTTTGRINQTVMLNLTGTSVFTQGGVCNLAHLRPGQFVKIYARLDHDQAIARSIEIVKSPQEMETGPATL